MPNAFVVVLFSEVCPRGIIINIIDISNNIIIAVIHIIIVLIRS
jgi:hypothetical protein